MSDDSQITRSDPPYIPSGVELIAKERQRQIDEEGFRSEHDDAHDMAELSGAAACYAIAANESAVGNTVHPPMLALWPWDMKWWKPSEDPIHNLMKAGALLAAEIDRLNRAKSKP